MSAAGKPYFIIEADFEIRRTGGAAYFTVGQ
jgi:hypothetical protein